MSKQAQAWHIGIDLMGGEALPSSLFEGVVQAAGELSALYHLHLIGLPEVLQACREALPAQLSNRFFFHEAAEEVFMDESPLLAVRRKKQSSMATGLEWVAQKKLHALISTGSTGVLFASTVRCLPLLPGVDRPALLAELPTKTHPIAVLDVGANVTCTARNLVQFARIGSAYQHCCYGIANPKIGLLNIGEEAQKGTVIVREAYQELEQMRASGNLNFLGNIEGREVFEGKVDVLVTDGFSGNIFLKTTEGIASFILDYLQQFLSQHPDTAIQNSWQTLRRHLNYSEYPGALFCGVDGIVVKCHGVATAHTSLRESIKGVARLLAHGFLDKMRSNLA